MGVEILVFGRAESESTSIFRIWIDYNPTWYLWATNCNGDDVVAVVKKKKSENAA